MFPPLPASDNSPNRSVVELVLAPGWRYNSRRRAFVSESNELFRLPKDLIAQCQLVYKAPSLAKSSSKNLSEAEKDLQRYMQLILPPGEPIAALLTLVQTWPCIASAQPGPEISLPSE